MTYDYGDWDDDHYGEGDTTVTLSLQGLDDGGGEHRVRVLTSALGGDVKLGITISPYDVLDFLHRFILYSGIDLDEARRIVDDVEKERQFEATKVNLDELRARLAGG